MDKALGSVYLLAYGGDRNGCLIAHAKYHLGKQIVGISGTRLGASVFDIDPEVCQYDELVLSDPGKRHVRRKTGVLPPAGRKTTKATTWLMCRAGKALCRITRASRLTTQTCPTLFGELSRRALSAAFPKLKLRR